MIYFDSAATTLQKPPSVGRALRRAVGSMASPGRGGHGASMGAADTVYRCREAAAELFSVTEPERVVFTHNATHGLNMAIKSMVNPGDRVLISGYEHNSVVRPLRAMGAEVMIAPSAPFAQEETVSAFAEKMGAEVKLIVCNHVSNVFGFVLPIEGIAALCRERGVPLIVDASQSAGVLEIDAPALGAAFIAMPGHKGLYGPQGTGILICGETPSKTLIEGGTGSDSLSWEAPINLPERLEAGTHNVPGIAGLLEGIRFVRGRGVRRILKHERTLLEQLVKGLSKMPKIRLFSASDPVNQTGVLSFILEDLDCEEMAAQLGAMDVGVRAGLHCSPLAHESAGTLETGTLRVSFSAYNTGGEVEQFLWRLSQARRKMAKNT